MDSVIALCGQRGERLTSLRREVLTILEKLDQPRTAYQILGFINKKRSPKLAAMSLYRVLDFLITLDVVLKSDSDNTYRLCLDHGHAHGHLVMICDSCGHRQEITDRFAAKKLHELADRYEHHLQHHVIEMHGQCAKCYEAH
ncbi:MAG: transcriptional repressor [Alphaproteobacteria bacterium]|nr:MAG: transcriptional repressor [Alphaproteobacteria bacterium]